MTNQTTEYELGTTEFPRRISGISLDGRSARSRIDLDARKLPTIRVGTSVTDEGHIGSTISIHSSGRVSTTVNLIHATTTEVEADLIGGDDGLFVAVNVATEAGMFSLLLSPEQATAIERSIAGLDQAETVEAVTS